MKIRSVMLIDDSVPDQFLAQTTVEEYDAGIEIHQAYNGQEALEMLGKMEKQPCVIFLDINMPVMNGLEFLAEYSKWKNQSTIIVMLTSSDQQKDKESSQAYPCVKKYFTKPLNVESLTEVICCRSGEKN